MPSWVLLVGGLVLLGGILVLFGPRADIRGPEARDLVGRGARLLDVRSHAEFASGHLPGALNIPLDGLERRLGEVGPKDRDVVVYCASGARSAQAKRALARHGFTSVHDLGSMRAW